MPWRHMG